MSERSLANLPSLASVAQRLRGRGAIVLLLTGGLAVGAVSAILLSSSSQPPEQVAVEIVLPPPAMREPGDGAPAAVTPSGRTDPAPLPGPGNALTVPPVPADAFAGVPAAPRAAPLPPAPDTALVETTAEGPLPRRGDDGRLPWQVYARPFPAGDGRARIAIVVSGLGPSAIVTREIIRRLPADVTLAFEPTAADVADRGREARAAGHEIMLSLPVQGGAFPFLDRGPEALAGDIAVAENRARLDRLLGRLAGYVGALANVGAETDATGDAGASEALALAGRELAQRGLLLVTPFAGQSAGGDVPQLRVDLAIGPDADVAAARARLAELEAVAVANGHSLAVAEPTPAVAEAVAAWAGTLPGKPAVLAPVSAVAQAVQARGR